MTEKFVLKGDTTAAHGLLHPWHWSQPLSSSLETFCLHPLSSSTTRHTGSLSQPQQGQQPRPAPDESQPWVLVVLCCWQWWLPERFVTSQASTGKVQPWGLLPGSTDPDCTCILKLATDTGLIFFHPCWKRVWDAMGKDYGSGWKRLLLGNRLEPVKFFQKAVASILDY